MYMHQRVQQLLYPVDVAHAHGSNGRHTSTFLDTERYIEGVLSGWYWPHGYMQEPGIAVSKLYRSFERPGDTALKPSPLVGVQLSREFFNVLGGSYVGLCNGLPYALSQLDDLT